jgi:TonB family protein
MRRVLFTALALLPGLAHAQVAASNGTRNPTAPLTLQAKVTPVAFARPVAFTAPAAAPAAPVARVVSRPAFHDVIKSELNEDVEQYAANQSATLEFRMGDGGNSTAPKLLHIVHRELPVDAISETTRPVAVRMVVSPQGVPEDLSIVHSAGPVVDQKTLDAVRQYRFQPATIGHIPVVADVTVEVALQKQ